MQSQRRAAKTRENAPSVPNALNVPPARAGSASLIGLNPLQRLHHRIAPRKKSVLRLRKALRLRKMRRAKPALQEMPARQERPALLAKPGLPDKIVLGETAPNRQSQKQNARSRMMVMAMCGTAPSQVSLAFRRCNPTRNGEGDHR